MTNLLWYILTIFSFITGILIVTIPNAVITNYFIIEWCIGLLSLLLNQLYPKYPLIFLWTIFNIISIGLLILIK